MNEWELLKENVEPIKSGRSIKTLKSALNEKPNELNAREMKRKEFESELRTYSGSDLLSVYYNYIVWVEQNYPLGGNEANLKTVLENCIEQFYAEDKYRNDERLLQVFLKFVKRVDNPLELFTFFHDNKFATKLSQFYINWSFHLENQKNCRKAGEVLRKGLSEKAEPIAALQTALEELEVRVAKAVVNNQIEELNDNDLDEQQRKPLNGLKSKTKKGKSVAPVKRVGTAIKNTTEGLKTSAVSTVQNKAPVIYCDENNPKAEPKPKSSTSRPQTSRSVKAVATVGQENEQKPGKWNENVLTQQRVVTETQPKFTIHADDSDDESPEAVRKPPESNTLKVRTRNADSPPLARFEKPDPFKKFFFNLNKVYAGGEEFSFEEIRGRKWMAKKKREEEALRTKKLEGEVEQLKAQVELLLKAQHNSQTVPQNVKKSFGLKEEQFNACVSNSPPQSSADSSAAKSVTNSSGNSNGTKAANSLVRDLWNGTLGNQTTDVFNANNGLDINVVINKIEEQVQKKERFTIFADTTILSKAEDKPPKPRESTGFTDYTIALPKSEQTFIAKASCSSTPVADKTKSVSNFDANVVESLQSNYNFVGGMTAKLSPIVETSREYNSKSSSSGTYSSGTMSTTGGQSAISRRQRALSGNIDPFDECVFSHILETINEPLKTRRGLFYVKRAIPKIKLRETVIKLGSDSYLIEKNVANGAYAKVYSAQIDDTSDSLEDESTNSSGFSKFVSQKWFALKVVKNANEREFYICDELHKRLTRSKGLPDIELSVMSVNPTVMFKDGCILVDEFAPNGTLLDVVQNCKPMPNTIVAYFALELLQIMVQIHKQHIIHADIKADNILVLNFPSREEVNEVLKRTSCLKVIDFGRSIDMDLYSKEQTFNVMVNTKGSQCCEMLDKKPWTYQTDWFGVLDCIHVMLFSDYIKVNKNKSNKWEIKEKFKRYHFLIHIWKPLFETLLNIPNCHQMPDLTPYINELNEYIKQNVNQLIRDSNDIETLNDSALKKKK